MRDRKISILLFVSFLLLLSSFLILCTWLYNYYYSDKKIVKNTPAQPQQINDPRDSILQTNSTSIKSLEKQLGNTSTRTDSIEAKLNSNLDEYYRLKQELQDILKKPVTAEELKEANEKINRLQKNIRDMRNSESTDYPVSNVNLGDVKRESSTNKPSVNIEQNKNEVVLFSAVEMNLSALQTGDADIDATGLERKILGSFTVRNLSEVKNGELMIIVIQPDGRVLQKSTWESGSFLSKQGKKIYSLKMNISNTNNEPKKVSFEIPNEKFTKGSYTLQVYNNGSMIGWISRVLS